MPSMYKNTHCHAQHVQERRSSLSVNTRAHSTMVSLYKSTRYDSKHVQEPIQSCPECTRLYGICVAEQKFCLQFMCSSFDTTSGQFWMPNISQLWLSKHDLPQHTTSTALRTTIIYTQTTTDMVKLTDVAPHSAMHAKFLNCLYHVTVLLDFNSEHCKGNNNLKNPKKAADQQTEWSLWHLHFLGTPERQMISIFTNVEVNKQQLTWVQRSYNKVNKNWATKKR